MFEVKLKQIIKTPAGFEVTANIYRTSAPISDGVDPVSGKELFHHDRTLLFSDTRLVPLGTTKTQIINFIKAKMAQRNLDDNLGFVAGDYYAVFGDYFN